MRTFLRTWLGVKDPTELKEFDEAAVTERISQEVEKRLDTILANMHSYSCYACQKDLISGKDAIYTNFEGKKFCSHECIDKNKESK